MKLRKILQRAKLIDDTVEFLEKKQNDIFDSFKSIENCSTPSCNEEKVKLTSEMASCVRKLRAEGRELDKCEEQFLLHATLLPTPTPHT